MSARPVRKVVIVCSGNTCRSPMAAAYLRRALDDLGQGAVAVESAGLHAVPGLPAAAEAREAVARDGLSLAEHRSRPLEAGGVAEADLILAMTRSQAEELRRRFPEAAGRVALWREWAAGGPLADADVPDPFGQGLADYQVLARQLRREAAMVARRLAGEAAPSPAVAAGSETAGSQTGDSGTGGGGTAGGGQGVDVDEHGREVQGMDAAGAQGMSPSTGPTAAGSTAVRPLRVAIGSDHAGFDLKGDLIAFMEERGIQVIDVGTHQRSSCDYPDFARAACLKVVEGEADRAVLICGTGIGMAIAANKIPGIRAACCTEPYSARLTRQDNDSNVLTLGARVVGPGMAREILATWLETPFAGGRHQRRIDKIAALERESMNRRADTGAVGAGGGRSGPAEIPAGG
ncbi:ribose 5-phosphate isomerase B [Thermaerobacter litoralis]